MFFNYKRKISFNQLNLFNPCSKKIRILIRFLQIGEVEHGLERLDRFTQIREEEHGLERLVRFVQIYCISY